MRLTCPACHAEASLEVLLGREVDARAVAALLERNLPLGELVVRYIALFRPGQRRLGLARMTALVTELLPDLERAAITRKGRDWPAPQEAWQAALETVLAKRDKGALTLPLTGHGLLYEVLCSVSEKAEAVAEREREAGLRSRRGGGGPAPRAVASAMEQALAPAPAPQAIDYSKPGRAAQEFKARMARQQAVAIDADDQTTGPTAGEHP